jgi:hypothetical protein
METLPVPENPDVTLLQVPGCRMAVVRYTGFWSESGYLKNKLKLKAWIRENEFSAIGDPIWARYDPPFIPWFLRRNEILIQVTPEDNQDMDQANINTIQDIFSHFTAKSPVRPSTSKTFISVFLPFGSMAGKA